MQVSYPLSLKVSVWLMLNLLLLAALGLGFFIVQGGLGWNALVAGPSGARAQAKANIIAAEVGAAAQADRNAVIERFKAAYGAEFYLFRGFDGQLAGTAVELPASVQTRIDSWRQLFRSPFGLAGSRGSRGGFGPRERTDREGGDNVPRRPPPDEAAKREPPPPPAPAETPDVVRERESGRFIVRSAAPGSYWIGMRVLFASATTGRPSPALLVARVDSFWALLYFLDLQAWLLAGTVVLLLSVLFWLPLVRGITRSIGQLTAATERIAEGRFDTRVDTSRRDELGKLGDSVNKMATRLDAHMNGQKRFLGDVAHELCSPLARLQMATGILGDQAPATLQETVSDVREEVQQMSTLVNELLAFTKAGLRSRDVVTQSVDLAPLAADVLAREDPRGRLTMNVAADLKVVAEPGLLARALGNLVRNALRYAGDAGPISVTAQRDQRVVALVVEDDGPGVPPGDLDRLGEPFFRPELARTRESGGVGLGLAIVRNSIAACGGEVRFSNRSPHGFRAEIRLPAA
jgi:two-component system sensor histidine kinase CpxA